MNAPLDWKTCLQADGATLAASTESPAHFGDPRAEYAALVNAVGVADFSRRTQVELRGPDRAPFLHNLCTNEIRKLPVGDGCEAFLTDSQGRILFFVHVFCGPESLVLETVPSQGERLRAHLDKYLIRERVELGDRSLERAELLVAGRGSAALLAPLASAPLPSRRLEQVELEIGSAPASVRRVELVLPDAYLVSCPRDRLVDMWQTLRASGARACGDDAVEMARIEAGVPYYGQDITDKNLPQELARDERAISFVKGCYLGQETVARIDALGHVNKTLVGVRFAGDSIPPPGTKLASDASEVGHVTSAAWSPRLSAPLALAYVRRGGNLPGALLHSSLGEATVVGLPIAS